jgi:hypothetical protein
MSHYLGLERKKDLSLLFTLKYTIFIFKTFVKIKLLVILKFYTYSDCSMIILCMADMIASLCISWMMHLIIRRLLISVEFWNASLSNRFTVTLVSVALPISLIGNAFRSIVPNLQLVIDSISMDV